jgi:hypothetical protein
MSTLSVATVKSTTTSPPTVQNSAGTEIGRMCRAFVNFNGTGTVAIRQAFNVTSITDNGVGDYTVNFTNAMPDANYSSALNTDTYNTANKSADTLSGANPTSSAFRFGAYSAPGTAYDAPWCSAAFFR